MPKFCTWHIMIVYSNASGYFAQRLQDDDLDTFKGFM